MDDFDLLQAYAFQRKEDAFNNLTGRYINLVYSAAARQTGNPQAAEDVTQAVFLTLARKASAISRRHRSLGLAPAHDALRRRQRPPPRTTSPTLRATSHAILPLSRRE